MCVCVCVNYNLINSVRKHHTHCTCILLNARSNFLQKVSNIKKIIFCSLHLEYKNISSSFAPLVFSISGGMGPIATTVYKRMASLIAEKQNHPYSSTLFWLRCKLSFSLLQSAVMCIRGSRSSYYRPTSMFNETINLSCF